MDRTSSKKHLQMLNVKSYLATASSKPAYDGAPQVQQTFNPTLLQKEILPCA